MYFVAFGLLSLLHDIIFLFAFDIYPAGFIYNNFNLFMDFFNTAYFSYFGNPYQGWKTVYLPLNFALLEIFEPFLDTGKWQNLIAINQNDIEQQSWISRFTLLEGNRLFFPSLAIVCAILTVKLTRPTNDDLNWHWRSLFFLLILISKPFLFCVERGNLLILAMPLMAWLARPQTDNIRSLCLALLLSLKIYLLPLIFAWPRIFNSVRHGFVVLLLVILLNAISVHWTGVDFNLGTYISNLMNFGDSNKPIVELVSLHYSILNWPALIDKTITHFGAPQYLSTIGKTAVIAVVLSVLTTSAFSLSRLNNFQDRLLIITLTICLLIPQAGGYVGIIVLPFTLRIMSYNDRLMSVAILFLLWGQDFGIYASPTGANWNLLLNTEQIGMALYGTMMWLRPTLLIILLHRLVYITTVPIKPHN